MNSCSYGTQEDESEEKIKEPEMVKLQRRFEEEGTISAVRCIILVHYHRHPHILLLNNKKTNKITIPGGRLIAGEDHETAICRILKKKLLSNDKAAQDIEIGEHVATWYRPQFTDNFYPYLPAHITKPKEVEKWYVVSLPEPKEERKLTIQAKNEPLFLPFYDINGNPDWQNKQIAEIPALMSRFNFEYEEDE